MGEINENKYSVEARLIYGKATSERWDFRHHVIPPLSMSTNFRFASAAEGRKAFETFGIRAAGGEVERFSYIYDRLDEPNKDLLEEHLAVAESGDIALVFSTGMAAIAATVSVLVDPGQEIVAHVPIYGCTYELLTKHFQDRLGIPVHLEDLTDLSALHRVLNERTALVYLESPSNPRLTLVDLKRITEEVDRCNEGRPPQSRIHTVVDNTFASPYCQRPLEFGVDLVVDSLTKHIGGFGTVMGGAVVARKKMLEKVGAMIQLRKDTGGSLSATSAWNLLVYGLSTLPVRMKQCQESAARIAEFLEGHGKVESVMYPGLEGHPQHEVALRQMRSYDDSFAPGAMVYFVLKGDPKVSRERGVRLCNHVAEHGYVLTLAVSLGQIRTLVEHPAGMTHAVLPPEVQRAHGIEPGGVRLSVGIEPFDDIRADLGEALDIA